MMSDGTNTYAWDAENRLIKITYPGSGNYSEIVYNANGIKDKITETVASTLTSTKQFMNSGLFISEERDASGAVIKKFFARGQTIGASNYFYTFDHLGSVREMTDSTGAIQAQYEYSPYGITTKTQGSLDSDFQYAGYYMHAPSGLNLTVYRANNSTLGRWINRDPIEEDGGLDLYSYGLNSPIAMIDPSGLLNVLSADPRTPSTFTAEKFYLLTGAALGSMSSGCIGVVDVYLGLGDGVVPESVYKKDCFWGDWSKVAPAINRAKCTPQCPKGTHKVIWCKQGTWGMGGLNPNAPGSPVNNPDRGWNNGGNSNFNYSVYFSSTNTFIGGNVGGGAFYTANEPMYGNEFGSSMCCASCVKN